MSTNDNDSSDSTPSKRTMNAADVIYDITRLGIGLFGLSVLGQLLSEYEIGRALLRQQVKYEYVYVDKGFGLERVGRVRK